MTKSYPNNSNPALRLEGRVGTKTAVRTRPQAHLINNWINIVLTVVSIIQGLAFNYLATKFPEVYLNARVTGNYLIITHFALCFMILLRVFQTYLTAVLDYNFGLPSFMEILLIFLIGGLEYFLFSSLSVAGFNVASFHKRIIVLCLLGIVGYSIAMRHLTQHDYLFELRKDYSREFRLQIANIGGLLALLGISFSLIFMNPARQTLLVSAMALTLAVNMSYSLRKTFQRRAHIQQVEAEDFAPNMTTSIGLPKLDIDITRPDREDVSTLCRLLVKYFGYVYVSVFDTSERLTLKLLNRIVCANRGKHSLGYRRFNIARARATGETVGLLLLKNQSSDNSISAAIGGFFIVRILLSNLGVVGSIRCWRNWRLVRPIIPEVEVPSVHIVYLAVQEDAQNRQVGKQLLEYVRGVANEENKPMITIDVRKKNEHALAFLRSQGFIEEHAILDDVGDDLLAQGPTIRMTLMAST
ncbi:MAG TPA: GNAT family N-acetyltransferase [Pyrinomonadaceae bacterium]|nr:GNAT family N-acetyltransferase [Pyrinomonadaceae bacterium]